MASHTLHEQVIYDIVLSCKGLSHAVNARVHIRTAIDTQNLSWLYISCENTFSNINNSKVYTCSINSTLRKKSYWKCLFWEWGTSSSSRSIKILQCLHDRTSLSQYLQTSFNSVINGLPNLFLTVMNMLKCSTYAM